MTNYICECGQYLSAKRISRGELRVCPYCGTGIDQNANREKRFAINCLCGAKYLVKKPSGDFLFTCKRCGRVTVQVKSGTLNLDIPLPRFAERRQ